MKTTAFAIVAVLMISLVSSASLQETADLSPELEEAMKEVFTESEEDKRLVGAILRLASKVVPKLVKFGLPLLF